MARATEPKGAPRAKSPVPEKREKREVERKGIYMLQIKDIRKKYYTGGLVQNALDGVSVNFRDNEFVAILGPSGSGKTTLLNVIGGLDRYDSGELIINGISTRKYKDRDWDSYRNHTIGFVFQSYNLIPHQSVLANVELALTISGVSSAERKKRATEALERVGLKDHIHKRTNQLSGGQMQRVAIARALVNDPEIVLADEPTGALDSETSVQVMDLLKEVAKDRLVVMVTHNPELAEEYATRIVRVKDGRIKGDTDPFEPDESTLGVAEHKNMGRSSMSRRMSLALSFNNLRTKKARTLLTAFAGSIGIIGIAMILSVSTGVNQYINDMEAKTMAGYPVQIQSNALDFTSLIGTSDNNISDLTAEKEEEKVDVFETMTGLFTTVKSNDMATFKDYLDSGKSGLEEYTSAIEYNYDVDPQLFLLDKDEKNYTQVNPSSAFASYNQLSMFSSTGGMGSFWQMPKSENLYKEQYEVKAGHWPEKANELVVVLTENGNISDLTMYALGLRDYKEFDDMMADFQKGKEVTPPEEFDSYNYEDILGITYKMVNSSEFYTYDKKFKVWTDKKENKSFMRKLVKNGEDVTIVGIVQPKEDATSKGLTTGINYPYELTEYVIASAKESEIVKAQMDTPDVNIFTGDEFGEEKKNEFNMESLFTIDEEAIQNAFQFDASGLGNSFDPSAFSSAFSIDPSKLDFNGMLDLDDIKLDVPNMPQIPLSEILSGIDFDVNEDAFNKMAEKLMKGYQDYTKTHPEADYSNLQADFAEYLNSDGQAIIQSFLSSVLENVPQPQVSEDEIRNLMRELVQAYNAQGYEDLSHFEDFLNSESARNIVAAWFAKNVTFDPSSIQISGEQLQKLATDLSNGYLTYAQSHGKPDPSKMGEHFLAYLSTDTATQAITEGVSGMIDTDALSKQLSKVLGSYMQKVMKSYGSEISKVIGSQMNKVMGQITSQIGSGMTKMMTQMMSQIGTSLQDSMNIDGDAFAKAFQFNMDQDDFMDLMTSMGTSKSATYESNLSSLGYVDLKTPTGINIYPKDFDSKEQVTKLLDDYNKQKKKDGKDEEVVAYTDIVGTLMSSVTTIVNSISYVLIVFVAISLVVSSIMIGVITYISVLERKKEIGILRAIGASKKNISQVFNAETGIIGLISGLIGIGLTLVLIVPANIIIHKMSGNPDINAALPAGPAVFLIALSVLLTLIGGLIPSKKASKSDPVTALRTD